MSFVGQVHSSLVKRNPSFAAAFGPGGTYHQGMQQLNNAFGQGAGFPPSMPQPPTNAFVPGGSFQQNMQQLNNAFLPGGSFQQGMQQLSQAFGGQ
jgi:hypothetical protein